MSLSFLIFIHSLCNVIIITSTPYVMLLSLNESKPLLFKSNMEILQDTLHAN